MQAKHDAYSRKIQERILSEIDRRYAATDKRLTRIVKVLQQLNRRFSDLGEYDVKSTSFVYFVVGSSVLTPQAGKELSEIANDALSVEGYLIRVGYTDSSGNLPQ